VVVTVETVECAVCHKTHLQTPPPREDGTFDARDWDWYKDNYKGQYVVICKKAHDEMIAPKGSKKQ